MSRVSQSTKKAVRAETKKTDAEQAMIDYIVDRFIYSGQRPDIFLPKLYAMLEQIVSET